MCSKFMFHLDFCLLCRFSEKIQISRHFSPPIKNKDYYDCFTNTLCFVSG